MNAAFSEASWKDLSFAVIQAENWSFDIIPHLLPNTVSFHSCRIALHLPFIDRKKATSKGYLEVGDSPI